MERNVLSLLVANHFGVLTRVTNLFGQRGFNIDSLAVGETENPRFSRITITTHGDERVINQIKLQLAKLEDVKAVVEIPEEQLFIREVVLIKAEPKKAQMEAFEQAVSDFGGRLQIVEGDVYVIELTDTPDSIKKGFTPIKLIVLLLVIGIVGCAFGIWYQAGGYTPLVPVPWDILA